jgi:hypothetical protein
MYKGMERWGDAKGVMGYPFRAEARMDRTPGFSMRYKEDRVSAAVHTSSRSWD